MSKLRIRNAGLAGVIIACVAAVCPARGLAAEARRLRRPSGRRISRSRRGRHLRSFQVSRSIASHRLKKPSRYIVVTFDPQGRPVVSQSSSGNGSSPRVLLDENRDGIFEGEKIVASQLNTCHGLFYASRTTLYANCRGEVPGDPPLPPAAQFGGRGQPPQPGAGGQRRRPAAVAGRIRDRWSARPASTSSSTRMATT